MVSAKGAIVENSTQDSVSQKTILPLQASRGIEPTIQPDWRTMVKIQSAKYGVSESLMLKVINCESQGSTTIQSLTLDPTGPNGHEDSWGIAQWHLSAKNTKKDGSIITKADALNPQIAIETMAWYFSRGLQSKWSCVKLVS